MNKETFDYSSERFGDIQMLRYQLDGFKNLTLNQKLYIYCLAQATLWGRDITFDQFGKYNLQIRRTLEAIVIAKYKQESNDFKALELYLKQVWFASGIHHHYAMDKFQPHFSRSFFQEAVLSLGKEFFKLDTHDKLEELCNTLCEIIFNPDILAKRVNKAEGVDLIQTSANNYYENVSQEEVEHFYTNQKQQASDKGLSFGLNTTLVKKNGKIYEEVWKLNGKYGKIIEKIIYWLNKATTYTENDDQKKIIRLLVHYYTTGDLHDFDKYSIAWVKEHKGQIDFINGFIEVYGDALGLKGSWEGIVHYKDLKATKRTQLISSNAQWFEDNSPVNEEFKKKVVKGVTANVVCAAMLGGDEYPASAIGINLPNADWIRAEHGSKSVTISNLTHAYNVAAKGNGFIEEFAIDAATCDLIAKNADLTDELHTDLHECLGHGSGKLLPETDSDALKNYGNTIEEARADLFGLYYIADKKLIELGLLHSEEAYKAQYYSYIMNGLMTQLARIKAGKIIEESHMQNRALIARWAFELGKVHNVIEFVQNKEINSNKTKTYIRINDYEKLREIFAQQLAEIQRIKSCGDFDAARMLVETYAIKVDEALHNEVLERYKKLNIAPYKGFINPRMNLEYDINNQVIDVILDYTESYSNQMMRYSKEYSI